MTGDTPRFRATDAERNRVLDVLQQALVSGQLDFHECDERSKSVMSAKYQDELLVPLADLMPHPDRVLGKEISIPSTHEVSAFQEERMSLASLKQVSPGSLGDSFSLALMSGSEKKGQWTVAGRHTSIAVMGGVSLDLRDAIFVDQHITIDAYAIMGGIEIIVPEDVRVKASGFPLMGGFAVNDSDGVRIKQDELPADAPYITITGLALMGGVEVVRKSRNER